MGMRIEVEVRNLVVLTTMPAQALDLSPFQAILEGRQPRSQVLTPPILVADYERLQLVAAEGAHSNGLPPKRRS
jgi:hypothetical protein